MFKKAGILFFYTLTPLHPGSGSSVAAVDLPIQREKYSHYPMLQASGVKGALRDLAEYLGFDEAKLLTVFGPKPASEEASRYGGAIAFTDARVLVFPVRSLAGVFAWVTCPAVLNRFQRDLRLLHLRAEAVNREVPMPIGLSEFLGLKIPIPQESEAYAPMNSSVKAAGDTAILEEFAFSLRQDSVTSQLAKWLAKNVIPQGDEYAYWKQKMEKDVLILPDNAFRDFVEFSTEVITRIQLGETGTVAQGPWDEEHLPSETVLYSLVLATDPKKEAPPDDLKEASQILTFLQSMLEQSSVAQFGGDETVGRGIVHLRYLTQDTLESVIGASDIQR
jgi:CRISPR-associated protein Cmr4